MRIHINLAIPESFADESECKHIHLDIEEDYDHILLFSLLTEEERVKGEGPSVTLCRSEVMRLASSLLHLAESYMPDTETDNP